MSSAAVLEELEGRVASLNLSREDSASDDLPANGTALLSPSQTRSKLSEKNAHERDDNLKFDAVTHTYTIAVPSAESSLQVISVTELIGSYFEPFEADKVIEKNYDKWQRSPSSPYKGKSRDEIKKQWEDACDLGTKLHGHIEAWYNGEKPDVKRDDHPEWDQFQKFHHEQGNRISPFRAEWRIWSDKYRLAGTIDLVSRDSDPKNNESYSLYDWKRTKQPIDPGSYCFGKYGKGPLTGVPDIKYNTYRLQLSLYKKILELHYDIKVTALYIVRFHPNMANAYQMVQVEYWPECVDRLLVHRLKQVKASQEQKTDLEQALGALSI